MRPIMIMLSLVLVAVLSAAVVTAASNTQQVNMTVNNGTITVRTPSTTYERVCSDDFSKQFEVVHTYDQTVTNYIYYNTTINNTIYDICEYDDNCTVQYNITFCESTNTTNTTKTLQQLYDKMETTRYACHEAQVACWDLYKGEVNITHKLNITGADIMDEVNGSLAGFQAFIKSNLLTNEQQCQNWKSAWERCESRELDLRKDWNITQMDLNNTKNWSWLGWGFAAFFALMFGLTLYVAFGRKGGLEVGPR